MNGTPWYSIEAAQYGEHEHCMRHLPVPKGSVVWVEFQRDGMVYSEVLISFRSFLFTLLLSAFLLL